MSRDLSALTIEAINEDTVHPFFAVELLFDAGTFEAADGTSHDSILRMWTGQGTLVLKDGTQWVGLGTLLNISTVEETTEMSVKGASITLTGIPSETISLALSQPYQGRVCNIYFGTFSSEGDILQEDSSYILLQDGSRLKVQSGSKGLNSIFSGYMDQMNIAESADTSTIELLVENKLIDLERARVARFTSGYQKSIYPNDLGLDFVEGLQDKTVSWGRKSA